MSAAFFVKTAIRLSLKADEILIDFNINSIFSCLILINFIFFFLRILLNSWPKRSQGFFVAGHYHYASDNVSFIDNN